MKAQMIDGSERYKEWLKYNQDNAESEKGKKFNWKEKCRKKCEKETFWFVVSILLAFVLLTSLILRENCNFWIGNLRILLL